jgi:hypothetical protein
MLPTTLFLIKFLEWYHKEDATHANRAQRGVSTYAIDGAGTQQIEGPIRAWPL